jgi:ABC-type polysaccharide/polyol phosphate transport system ATPase subunit
MRLLRFSPLAGAPQTADAAQGRPSSEHHLPPVEPAVEVRAMSKNFRLSHHQMSTLKERVLHPLGRPGYNELKALQDVTFDVREGEFFAVIGRNGSGKSTLLKCLAGIYRPNSGSVDVRGRLSPFIELGVGFNPDLNALDNVVVNATLIGLTPAEARKRFRDIIAFAELEDFTEMKLKNYSSGMQVRLGFATAIQVDSEILLVDEVLAVGDALFQRKCFDTFRRLKDEGRTIIYVSHDLDTVRRFADRVLLLEKGELIALDEPDSVIREYERRNRESEEGRQEGAWSEKDRFGDGSAEIVDAWFEDQRGERVSSLTQGEQATFKFKVLFKRDMHNPVLGFNVRDEGQRIVLNVNNVWSGCELVTVLAGEQRTFVASFRNWLASGPHFATPIAAHSDGQQWADLRDRYVPFDVEARLASGALVDLPQDVQVLRG